MTPARILPKKIRLTPPRRFILFVLLVGAGAPVFAAELPVTPAVRQWREASGKVSLSGAPIVIASADEARLRPSAEALRDDLTAMGLPAPKIVVGEKTGDAPVIALELTPSPFDAGPGVIEAQSYSLTMSAAGARIAAHDKAGVFSGTRPLLQLLEAGGRGNASVPCGTIVDGPVTGMRALMLDVGRKAFPIGTLHDYVKLLSWYRMNTLHLHLTDCSFDRKYAGFRVQCDTFPGLTSTDCFYTKKDLRALQDEAAARGVMIIPEIDMPGHAAGFTKLWPELAWRKNPMNGNLDVNNPGAVARMKELLAEMIPIFDAPYFHIGTDEYRVPFKDREERETTGENFRKFINTMNAFVRSKGKECVVWDGWEHSAGKTEIDPTVVVDMWWGIFDTNAYLARGHKVINSNQGVTYLTSGRPVYGVNNTYVYERFKPNTFGKVNPPMNSLGFLGTKLHVWVGQGPTGWTMTEIADQVRPSLTAFSETLWGVKGSDKYAEFVTRAAPVSDVPGVKLLDRIPSRDGVVLDHPGEIKIKSGEAPVALPFADAARQNLEFPWTLTMEVRKDATNGRGVILSSDLAEICDAYVWNERKKVVNAAEAARGKEKVSTVVHTGFGVVRAAGFPGKTPAEAGMAPENSRVYADSLPTGRWVKVTVVATRKHTEVWFDGQKVGAQKQQTICPLARIGSTDAKNAFVGAIRNLRVTDRAEPPAP